MTTAAQKKKLADDSIEQALIAQFQMSDTDGNGVLSAREFYKCMTNMDLGLDRDDVLALLAEADENADGFLDYREFVPLAVDLLEAGGFSSCARGGRRASADYRE